MRILLLKPWPEHLADPGAQVQGERRHEGGTDGCGSMCDGLELLGSIRDSRKHWRHEDAAVDARLAQRPYRFQPSPRRGCARLTSAPDLLVNGRDGETGTKRGDGAELLEDVDVTSQERGLGEDRARIGAGSENFQHAPGQAVTTLCPLVRVGVGSHGNMLACPRGAAEFALEDRHRVDLDDDLPSKVGTCVEAQIGVGGPGATVAAVVGAPSVDVDRPAKGHATGTRYLVEDRARLDLMKGDPSKTGSIDDGGRGVEQRPLRLGAPASKFREARHAINHRTSVRHAQLRKRASQPARLWQTPSVNDSLARPQEHDPESLLADLNTEQQAAVKATSGPVCIIAGAGTGKTRVMTRRVAYAAATGAIHPGRALVVTFTEKASAEMRHRLGQLGLGGVRAATFHAAALAQLRYFWPRVQGADLPETLESKLRVLNPIRAGLPGGYRFTATRDLAGEIEWAKSQRIAPAGYEQAVAATQRSTPVPPGIMSAVFERYERAKQQAGRLDFEDMLGRMVELLDQPLVAEEVRDRYRWFCVDEYQDTNPLQQALLEAWLGDRDDLAVVGDADQTIYTFTGATSRYLTGFRRRFPQAQTVRLVQNYRSTPQVLAFANRLLASRPLTSGASAPLHLQAVQPSGPSPRLLAANDSDSERAALVAEVRRLLRLDIPPREIAILVRTNAQVPAIEDALRGAGISYQVHGARFFRRPEVRHAIRVLRGRAARIVPGQLAESIEAIWFEQLDFRPAEAPKGEEAADRHAALLVLLDIARHVQVAAPAAALADFVAELAEREEAEASGTSDAVNLLTYHRAKGLEFDAVLLPTLEEGVLPIRQAEDAEAVEEERRLLYVGITRARTHLWLAWSAGRGAGSRSAGRAPSRFLAALKEGLPEGSGSRETLPGSGARRGASHTTPSSSPGEQGGADAALQERLRSWRRQRSQADGVPAYIVCSDRTLRQLAECQARSLDDLLRVEGIGPAKVERYGADLLSILAGEPDPKGASLSGSSQD